MIDDIRKMHTKKIYESEFSAILRLLLVNYRQAIAAGQVINDIAGISVLSSNSLGDLFNKAMGKFFTQKINALTPLFSDNTTATIDHKEIHMDLCDLENECDPGIVARHANKHAYFQYLPELKKVKNSHNHLIDDETVETILAELSDFPFEDFIDQMFHALGLLKSIGHNDAATRLAGYFTVAGIRDRYNDYMPKRTARGILLSIPIRKEENFTTINYHHKIHLREMCDKARAFDAYNDHDTDLAAILENLYTAVAGEDVSYPESRTKLDLGNSVLATVFKEKIKLCVPADLVSAMQAYIKLNTSLEPYPITK